MRLWTIHKLEVWDAIQKDGFLRYVETESHVFWDREVFLEPYRWMAEQMRIRVGEPPAGIAYPVWAWAQWKPGRLMPDLRTVRRWYAPELWVRLQCNVPKKQVLLSDHEAWHFALNRWYLPESEADYAAYENVKDNDVIRRSWERIFDIDTPNDYLEYNSQSERQLQATMWEIRREQIESVDIFRGMRTA